MKNNSLKSTASTEATGLGLDAPTGSPSRIWRRRIKGWKMPPNTVSVCRPGKWGNPFVVGRDGTAAEVVEQYKCLTQEWPTEQAAALAELRGKNLACFCKLGRPCHVDVLLGLANAKGDAPGAIEKL